MKVLPRFPWLVRAVLSTAILVPAVVTTPAQAQAPAAPAALPLDQQDANEAARLIDQGDFKGAASLYEGIPVKYPSSAFVPQAKVRLGYVYFRLGEFDKAVKALQESTTASGTTADVVELALSLIPQVLSAKAAAIPPESPARKLAFEEVVKGYDAFLQKFPKSDEVESANYGKAVALYQTEKYDLARQALTTNLQTFPQSETVLDSQYLLALTYGTMANVSAKIAQAKDPAIEQNYERAEAMMTDVVKKGMVTDVALANDARFQIGEMLFARAGFSKDEEAQKAMFNRALEAFRVVASKDMVIAAQKNRIERLKALRMPAIQQRNEPLLKRLPRIIEREQEKLASLDTKTEQTILAKMKMGEIYFRQHRFDESRVMLNYTGPLTQDPELKKEIAYYTVLSLGSQNVDVKEEKGNPALGERTEKAYTDFQTTYKGDPIGENLALVVGSGFINSDPQKAIKYFQEQSTNFPQSPLKIAAQTQMAAAYERMGNYDEALKMYRSTLEQKPEKEIAATAEFGIATILQKTEKIPEALAQFKVVRDNYSGTDQAEQAAFFLGQITLQTGDAKAATTELQAFLKNYPKSALVPQGLFFLAQAQKGQNQAKEAVETYKDLAAKYPKSEVAPFSYFERARISMDETKPENATLAMEDFIKAYPDSPQLYQAYDFIAQVQASLKQDQKEVAAYEDFIKSKGQDPNAPQALLKLGNLWKDRADKLGRFQALNPEQQEQWKSNFASSINANERLLRTYPESQQVALALKTLLDCYKLRVNAKLASDDDLEKYFQALAAEFKDRAAIRSKIVFTSAANTFERDKAKAIELMASVYDPNQKYAPDDLDLYSTALVDQKKLDEAEKIFQKLAVDYPLAPNTEPNKAATSTQIAQSISIFGLGKVLQERGKVDEAKLKFSELEKSYGWSPKMLEANYGIALSLFNEKKYEDALQRLKGLIMASKAPAELRAKGMLLLAQINEEMKNYEEAIANYAKIDTFYRGVPKVASEGLWRAAQLLERQVRGDVPIATPAPVVAQAKKPGAPPAPTKK